MGQESNITKLQAAVDLVDRIARGKIPEQGWTLIMTSWDDGTYQIEYRHSNDDGIHRFIYWPHRQPDQVCYRLQSADHMEKSAEGKFELNAEMIKSEYISVDTAPKACQRVHNFEHFDLMKSRGVNTDVTVEIRFDAEAFKKDPGRCINYKLLKTSETDVQSIEEFSVEELLSLQCILEAVLFNVVRPRVAERLAYEKQVSANIDSLLIATGDSTSLKREETNED